MEIRDVEVMVLATPGDYGLMGDGGESHGPRHSCVFLLHTDEDLTGISQVETQPHVAAAIVEAPGKRLCWMSSGVPRAAISKDGVEDGQKLPQGRHQRDLRRVASGTEALVERGEDRIVTRSGDGGHVQHAPHRSAALLNHATAPQGAAIAVEGRDADQSRDLPAVEVAQFREFGDERRGGDRAHSRYGPEQVLGLPPRRTGPDRVMEVGFEVAEGLLEPRDMGVDAALKRPIPDQAPPIGLRPEHLHELTPAGDELAEVLDVFGGQRPNSRAHGFGKVGDDAGVQRIGFGERPGGASEIPDLAGIDDGDRQVGTGQGGRHGGLIAPGGFEDHQRGAQRLQPGDELDEPGLIRGDDEGLVPRQNLVRRTRG